MSCEQWDDSWVGTLYGELDDSRESALREHLEDCESCRETLGRLETTTQWLREARPAVPPAPRVVVLQPSRSRAVWNYAAGLAAAVLLFAFGLMAGSRQADDRMLNIDQRLAQLEQTGPTALRAGARPASLDEQQLRREIEQLKQRLDRGREEDLQQVLRWISESQLQTETHFDRTNQALQMVALRQDPRFVEQ